jgi:hypothetical protein
VKRVPSTSAIINAEQTILGNAAIPR